MVAAMGLGVPWFSSPGGRESSQSGHTHEGKSAGVSPHIGAVRSSDFCMRAVNVPFDQTLVLVESPPFLRRLSQFLNRVEVVSQRAAP